MNNKEKTFLIHKQGRECPVLDKLPEQNETNGDFLFDFEKSPLSDLNKLADSVKRCSRNVGYKNSVLKVNTECYNFIYNLKEELGSGRYKPSKGRTFTIYEPKEREVTAICFKDRVVQGCICTEIFYKYIISILPQNTFACIKERGVDQARGRIVECLKTSDYENTYFLKTDIKSFFQNINHQKLLGILSRYIRNKFDLKIIEDAINSTGGDVGIGLGSEISQLSATVFLIDIDKIFRRKKYVRYMDDICFFGTKEECKKALEIIKRMTAELGLSLSDKKTFIQPIRRNNVPFLGFTFKRTAEGKVTLRKKKTEINNEKRKLRKMQSSNLPYEYIINHYMSIRGNLKIGSRSTLVKMDRYFAEVFGMTWYEMKKLVAKKIEEEKERIYAEFMGIKMENKKIKKIKKVLT